MFNPSKSDVVEADRDMAFRGTELSMVKDDSRSFAGGLIFLRQFREPPRRPNVPARGERKSTCERRKGRSPERGSEDRGHLPVERSVPPCRCETYEVAQPCDNHE